MKLHVLGSSSKGNGYLLRAESSGEVLALEAGVRLSAVKREFNFNISSISGLLVTHRHGDHAGYIREFANAGIPVYTAADTIRHAELEGVHCVNEIQPMKPFNIGTFQVIAFDVLHDVPCLGFLIRHSECGTVLFATDTRYLKNRFGGLNNILIECNYRLDILDANTQAGFVSPVRRDRTIRSHMSYKTCLETLQANDLSAVNNIVLIHLSPDNSHASEFVSGIYGATGKNVIAAAKGLVIDFDKTPY